MGASLSVREPGRLDEVEVEMTRRIVEAREMRTDEQMNEVSPKSDPKLYLDLCGLHEE